MNHPLIGSDTIAAQVNKVAEARDYAAILKAQYALIESDFRARHESQLAQVKAAADIRDQEETALRALVLSHFEATGERKPAPGVEVKVRKTIDFDPKAALLWARGHGVAVVNTLDEKVFTLLVPNLPEHEQQEVKYVCTETPTVFIAKVLEPAPLSDPILPPPVAQELDLSEIPF